MTCAGCGADNREGRKFCGHCGAALGLACPTCGTENEPDERFCGECGRPLVEGATPEPSTPEHLAEKILDARPTLEGERKQVTVLFADVKGSMELAEGLDPEEWAGIMDHFFSLLTEGVHRFEGTVDKFTGDGIMALFGAPLAHEDHARRACHAALHLTQAVSTYSEELRRTRSLNFDVRIGLNSGEVVVGRIGDDARMEYTALGHTVGLAQRMESLAEAGSAYLTEHTARLVRGHFRLRDLGRFTVKGAAEPVGVFALEGAGRRRRPYGVGRWPGRSPLVGRAEEMAALEAALGRALQGQAQVVGVVGEAGVGKSRLCEEFARACDARELTVRRTAGVSHARMVPLLPILELQRDYFGISDADTPRSAREKIAGRLLLLDPAFAEDLPLFFDFMEIRDPDRPPPRLSAEARMRRVFEVIRRLGQRRSEREALVLVLEDLHWFDPQSEGFLNELIVSFPGTRTLVVANFRPEFSASWMRHSYYRQLSLQPLMPEGVRELLAAVVGDDPSLAPLSGHVIERTAGNPFFVEEVVRDLVENETLAGEPGAYRLTRPLGQLRVPATVQAVLAARIDRLPEREKQLLQTAAVIGRTFPEAVLAAVAGRADEDLASALRALSMGEFLQEETTFPGLEYRFWHPLTQEVAYGSLLSERRARLHGAVARALVDLDPARHDERAALIASHFEAAGEALEAARWNARAASAALRSDVTEAVRRWRATVDLLVGVTESEDVLRLGIIARTRLLQFGSRMGLASDEAETLFSAGRDLAERLGDVGLLAGITQFRGTVELAKGKIRESIAYYFEAARLGDASDDPGRRATAWMSPPVFMAYAGPLPDALPLTEKVIALCEGDSGCGVQHAGYSPLVSAIRTRAELLGLMGRLAEACHDVEHALAMARERSEGEMLAWTLSTRVGLAHFVGEEFESLSWAEEALRITEESGNVMFQVVALGAFGLATLEQGRWEEAAAAFVRAVEKGRAQGGHFEEARLLSYLAWAQLDGRDGEATRRAADEALAVAGKQGARVVECFALLTRGRAMRLTGGPRQSAFDDLSAALALAQEVGAATYEPFIAEERARLQDDEDGLAEAAKQFAAIGATGHARRLEAELGGI